MCCPAEICTSKCPDDADRHHHVFGGGLIPTYLLINNLGMLNTIWAMLIPDDRDVQYDHYADCLSVRSDKS